MLKALEGDPKVLAAAGMGVAWANAEGAANPLVGAAPNALPAGAPKALPVAGAGDPNVLAPNALPDAGLAPNALPAGDPNPLAPNALPPAGEPKLLPAPKFALLLKAVLAPPNANPLPAEVGVRAECQSVQQ
jgi:hypothetical protein